MAVSLKKLFGQDPKAEPLPAELRSLLAQMQRERIAFEALTTGARESAQQLTQLTQPIADTQKTVSELQTRIKALERLVPVLATLDAQTEAVSKVQLRTETQLGHVSEDATRLRTEIEELRGTLDAALALKDDLAGFLELGGGFKALRIDADNLAAQLRDFAQGFERVRERQEEIRRAGDAAASRLDTFEERQQQVQGGVAATETRAAALERSLEHVEQVAAEVAHTKQQFATLKSLADYVTQKISALEQQREVVDRVSGQAEQLSDLMREIDQKIRKHEESAKGLGELEAKVNALQARHGEMLDRSAQVTAHQEEVTQADQGLRNRLAALREEVQRTVKRFESENQGIDAVSQRILDLRGALTDMEVRFRSLDDASKSIADVRSRTDALVSQIGGIAENIGQLETQAERVSAVQADAERLGQTVEDMTQRVARLEKAQPSVAAALEDFTSLKGTHEAIKGVLEQVRVTESEIARVREAEAGTKAWLASVTQSVDALRGELVAVEEMKPTVELVRSEADRLSQSMALIESRRRLVDDLDRRLSDLASLGSQLEERSRGLLARMDAADDRFKALALHAEEAERIEKVVPAAVAAVERAEYRMAAVEAAVQALEGRSQNLEGLAERTRALGQELVLRQAALDQAAEHLEQASRLREEAATAAQQLEDRTRELTGALASAGGRASELTSTLDELDSRAGTLRFAQKRMAQFEERLAKWEAAEQQLMRGLEQVAQRQATVDALQADLHRLFEVSERTVDDVRSIAAAKEEVTRTRATLETVLGLVGHAHDAADGLEHRKRQVERAEERLARVEALLVDIQSSLETLHGQKAFLDQVVEKAGALEFHAKQAEALINTLREERDITDRVRAAVAQMRQENVAPQ